MKKVLTFNLCGRDKSKKLYEIKLVIPLLKDLTTVGKTGL